jgi:hypothetical protein
LNEAKSRRRGVPRGLANESVGARTEA